MEKLPSSTRSTNHRSPRATASGAPAGSPRRSKASTAKAVSSTLDGVFGAPPQPPSSPCARNQPVKSAPGSFGFQQIQSRGKPPARASCHTWDFHRPAHVGCRTRAESMRRPDAECAPENAARAALRCAAVANTASSHSSGFKRASEPSFPGVQARAAHAR